MEPSALLQQNREAVLEKWFEAIAETYPRQTSQFLTRQKDRFRNPIGYAIERSIGPVYDQLSTDMNEDALRDDLDSIIEKSTSPHHLFHTITEEAAMRLHMTKRLIEADHGDLLS